MSKKEDAICWLQKGVIKNDNGTFSAVVWFLNLPEEKIANDLAEKMYQLIEEDMSSEFGNPIARQ